MISFVAVDQDLEAEVEIGAVIGVQIETVIANRLVLEAEIVLGIVLVPTPAVAPGHVPHPENVVGLTREKGAAPAVDQEASHLLRIVLEAPLPVEMAAMMWLKWKLTITIVHDNLDLQVDLPKRKVLGRLLPLPIKALLLQMN